MEKLINGMVPGTFEVFDKVPFIRLEDGRIAVEEISNIILKTSKEEVVELYTLKEDTTTVRFWKIGARFNALATDSFVELSEDVEFVDIYEISELEGAYVKYKISGAPGILFVSETEISIVYPHSTYKDIFFGDEYFYAETYAGTFFAFNQLGEIMYQSNYLYRKVKDYDLYYTDSKIFNSKFEKTIGAKILEVKVFIIENLRLVRVKKEDGVHYYNDNFVYLFGPLELDKYRAWSRDSLYLLNYHENKRTSVYYISNGGNTCKTIPNTTEVEYKEDGNNLFFLATQNGVKNVYSHDLECFMEGVEDCFVNSEMVIGYNNGVPSKLRYLKDEKKSETYMLEFIAKDNKYNNRYIFKTEGYIVCVDGNELIFKEKGDNCLIRDRISGGRVYIIERKDGSLLIFDALGEHL